MINWNNFIYISELNTSQVMLTIWMEISQKSNILKVTNDTVRNCDHKTWNEFQLNYFLNLSLESLLVLSVIFWIMSFNYFKFLNIFSSSSMVRILGCPITCPNEQLGNLNMEYEKLIFLEQYESNRLDPKFVSTVNMRHTWHRRKYVDLDVCIHCGHQHSESSHLIYINVFPVRYKFQFIERHQKWMF